MLPDYLTLNGYEIINSARATAYGARLDECGGAISACFECDGLEEWLSHGQGYRSISEDPAPWYDPASPESQRVYGVVGLAVEGLATGAYVQEGSAEEAPSGATRDILFRVLIEAQDDCAADYAAGWLREAIEWSGCGQGCRGASACMLSCCPEFDQDGNPVENPIRNMFGLYAVEGPEETERAYADDRVYLIYEFTLRTTNVDIFKPPPLERVVTVDPGRGERVQLDLPAVYEACEDPPDCLTDPDNPAPDPPPRPTAPLDPRYPTNPYAARRTVVSLPAEWMSRTLPVVPVVTIDSGGLAPMRNFLVRFYHNPFGADCASLPDLNPCRACTDILITYIPTNGQAVIDGRQFTKVVTCRSREGISTGDAVAFGPAGAAFQYPVFSCGASICMEIYTADPTPPGASVVVELYQRAGAG